MSRSLPVDEVSRTDGSPSHPKATTCGACLATNPKDGQFCVGCGHALHEPCPQCTKPVRLSQSFCSHCGCDLVAAVSQRKASLESKIANAISAAKERDFAHSRSLLALVTKEKDYRFKDVVSNATVAMKKIDSVADQECESAAERIGAAQQAYEVGDSARVVELLGPLSPNLLTPEAKGHLERSRNRIDQIEQAEASLQEAFQKRDWASSGAILDRLMDLKPDDESVSNLALKVGKKLLTKAATLRQEHKYDAASDLLQCVPANARGQDYDQMYEIVERTQWLAAQFHHEPFATPTLGRLARQWVEQSGGDPRANKVLSRISSQIKTARPSRRDLFAPLETTPQSCIGGPIGMLAFPTSINFDDNTQFKTSYGQFNVAIGLAIQGLGLGRVNEDFSPKKGLIKRLSRKKSDRCWGLDISASALKAVCLEAVENDRPKLVECYTLPVDKPMTRGGGESNLDEVIRSSVEHFLSEHDVESAPVWVSFPARELVSRFVNLPPVSDKQVRPLFDREVESRIPLPLDEVACVSWIAPFPDDALTSVGRPAFVAAAKQQFVNRYIENLSLAGLTVSGLQATPIALVNFASLEFADQLQIKLDEIDDSKLQLPTVALLDCGAEMTVALLISGNSCWFWSFESGGNEYTRLVSRATKTIHGEAEKLKRNPASLERPEVHFEMVEKRIEEMQGRLRKIISDVALDHKEFDIQHTWCCGGGSLTHGWIKRILCVK